MTRTHRTRVATAAGSGCGSHQLRCEYTYTAYACTCLFACLWLFCGSHAAALLSGGAAVAPHCSGIQQQWRVRVLLDRIETCVPLQAFEELKPETCNHLSLLFHADQEPCSGATKDTLTAAGSRASWSMPSSSRAQDLTSLNSGTVGCKMRLLAVRSFDFIQGPAHRGQLHHPSTLKRLRTCTLAAKDWCCWRYPGRRWARVHPWIPVLLTAAPCSPCMHPLSTVLLLCSPDKCYMRHVRETD